MQDEELRTIAARCRALCGYWHRRMVDLGVDRFDVDAPDASFIGAPGSSFIVTVEERGLVVERKWGGPRISADALDLAGIELLVGAVSAIERRLDEIARTRLEAERDVAERLATRLGPLQRAIARYDELYEDPFDIDDPWF